MLSKDTVLPSTGVVEGAGVRIRGVGAMADLVRSHLWLHTSLGAIEAWPPELVAAVNMMLASQLPTTLYWGGDRMMIYNDRYAPHLGERHPALGKSLRDVWPEVHDDVEAILGTTFATGESTRSENVPFPLVRRGAVVETFYTLMTDPIWCEAEDRFRVAGVYHTATDQCAALLAMREEHQAIEDLTQVLEATSDAIMVVNRNWVVTYLNPKAQALYGTVSPLLGRSLWEAFPDAGLGASPFREPCQRAMDKGSAGCFEAHYPPPLNAWLRFEVSPTRDGIVLFSRDTSEHRRISAELLQTEKLAAVGRLASSIAHEINNPLASVTNLLYLVRRSSDLAEVHAYAETAERELRRVALIANQALRFHKQSTRPLPAFCYDLIGDSLSIYQGRLVNARIEVEKRKRATHAVHCFEGEIRQVLSNLIGNAIDAMPAGGRLLLRSRDAKHPQSGEPGIVLTVADTGSGMSREVQKHIFQPFFTTKGIGGTGLGLWFSAEIVDRHNGSLRVRSSTRHGASGSVFTVFLPLKAVQR